MLILSDKEPVYGILYIAKKAGIPDAIYDILNTYVMTTLSKLESKINKIEARNSRVESDKAWETSLTRRLLLIFFTYLAIGLYMRAIGVEKWWLNAVIPSVGFMLSTLTLPFFKRVWLRYFQNR